MNGLRGLCGAILAGLLATVGGAAQDKEDAGPKVEPIPRGFRMFLVADGRFDVKDERNRTGKLHDPVAEYGLDTVVASFIRGVPKDASDPAFLVLKKQQELCEKYRAQKLEAFASLLALDKDFAADRDDDVREKVIGAARKLAQTVKTPQVEIGVAEGVLTEGAGKDEVKKAPPQLTAWGIDADDAITIIVYHRFKVVKRWKFAADKPPTDADLKEVEAAVHSVLGRKRIDDDGKDGK
jgi:hypothetical protein